MALVEITPPSGKLSLLATFAESQQNALKLANLSPEEELAKTRDYYSSLVASAVCQTGDKAIDECFTWAAINLDYNWYRGIGWVESIHHWVTMFTQLFIPAADHLGQADRSKACLKVHLEQALGQDGRMLSMNLTKKPWTAFGWNQYFFDSLGHYLRWTGDVGFAKEALPGVKRILANTRERFDADGNDLLGWEQQIGYQEDYVMAPRDSASATLNWIRMNEVGELVARLAGDGQLGLKCRQSRERAEQGLKASLYDGELGRFGDWRDGLGTLRHEGAWHTFGWPVKQGTLTPVEAWAGLEHFRAALMSERGLPYLSQRFPGHPPHTTGCQEGDLQALDVALCFAKAGDPDQAASIIKVFADFTMAAPCLGSFTETIIPWPTWFSPPAALYVEAVTEGLFGVKLDRLEGLLTVSPSLPEAWPEAKLSLPDYDLSIAQAKGRYSLEVSAEGFERARLAPWLPPAVVKSVKYNGQRVPFAVEAGVGRIQLIVEQPFSGKARLEVECSPVDAVKLAPTEACPGEELSVALPGCQPVELYDPAGVFESSRLEKGKLSGRLRGNLLDLAHEYGQMGKAVFSDRTPLVLVEQEGAQYWVALPLRLAPAVEVRPDWDVRRNSDDPEAGYTLGLTVANRTSASLDALDIRWLGESFHKRLSVIPGKEARLELLLSWEQLAAASPGVNTLEWSVPGTRYGGTEAAWVKRPAEELPALAEDWAGRCEPVKLPAESLRSSKDWRQWREFDDGGHQPWASLKEPLEGLVADEQGLVKLSASNGVAFELEAGKLAPVGYQCGQPALKIPVGRQSAKLYLLVAGLLTNEDSYAPVARVTAQSGRITLASRVLHFPGDLDWWYPGSRVGEYASFGTGWSKATALQLPEAVASVIELELPYPAQVDWVEISALAEPATLGVLAVSTFCERQQTIGQKDWLAGGTLLVEDFESGTLEGWTTAGEAWTVGKSYQVHARHGQGEYFADSLGRGETFTGALTSPPFTITGKRLTLLADGWRAGGLNWFALKDAETGEELLRIDPPDHTGEFVPLGADVTAFEGRKVVFEAVDGATATAYAWLAFDRLRLED